MHWNNGDLFNELYSLYFRNLTLTGYADDGLLNIISRSPCKLTSFGIEMPCSVKKITRDAVEKLILRNKETLQEISFRSFFPVDNFDSPPTDGRLSPALCACENLRKITVDVVQWPTLDGDSAAPQLVPQVKHCTVLADGPNWKRVIDFWRVFLNATFHIDKLCVTEPDMTEYLRPMAAENALHTLSCFSQENVAVTSVRIYQYNGS